MTKQKKVVLEIINEDMGHLTAEEIFSKARLIINNISLGTVYRNLNILCDENYIRRIKTPLGYDVYDKSIIPHGHIICPKCGKIRDYHSDKLDMLLKNEMGINLRSYQLILDVLCDDCCK